MEDQEAEDLWQIDFADIELDTESEIGRGQFGAVYKGNLFGSDVAVKKLIRIDEADQKYLKREQDLLRQLSHPNIIQFIGLSAHEGFLWLVSEFASNGCLRDVLYSETKPIKPIAWSLRVQWALDCVQALAFVHSKSLMHRDLKAENLLLDGAQKVKVCDFGFARRVDKKLDKLSNTNKKKNMQLTIAGTDEWMAPEVIQGVPYGQPADIFSFGITLTEMILRVKPEERPPRNAFDFEVEEFNSAVFNLADGPCPPEFAAVVIQCCKYEPDERPEAKMLVRGLKELVKLVQGREKEAAASSEAAEKADTDIAAAAAAAAAASPRATMSPRPSGEASMDQVSASHSSESGVSPRPPRLNLEPATSPRGAMGGVPVLLGDPSPPYVGVVPTEEDVQLASMAPNEHGLFRVVPVPTRRPSGRRLKWVMFQDATPSDHQGWLKASFGPEFKKELKLYFVLCSDVLYYFKNNKKGEKNLGRILVAGDVEVVLKEAGKKKAEVMLKNWADMAVRLIGSLEEIKDWNSHLLEAKSAELLNLSRVFQTPKSPEGLTPFVQDTGTYSFPVRVPPLNTTLLLCISKAGLSILAAFLEEVILELPWSVVTGWQISRNEMVEITLGLDRKKPLLMEFECLAWVQAAQVFSVLESVSKGAGAAPPPAKSPRTSMGGKRVK